ncbi:MAG: hypothetical protein IJ418_12350 [Clostridia bacterium]|nr:hypothetical protein [Clostridia bacterium]
MEKEHMYLRESYKEICRYNKRKQFLAKWFGWLSPKKRERMPAFLEGANEKKVSNLQSYLNTFSAAGKEPYVALCKAMMGFQAFEKAVYDVLLEERKRTWIENQHATTLIPDCARRRIEDIIQGGIEGKHQLSEIWSMILAEMERETNMELRTAILYTAQILATEYSQYFDDQYSVNEVDWTEALTMSEDEYAYLVSECASQRHHIQTLLENPVYTRQEKLLHVVSYLSSLATIKEKVVGLISALPITYSANSGEVAEALSKEVLDQFREEVRADLAKKVKVKVHRDKNSLMDDYWSPPIDWLSDD